MRSLKPRRLLTFLCALLLPGGLPAVLAEEPVVLRAAYQAPADSHIGENFLLFRNAAEEASGGRIDIELLPGGALFLDAQIPGAVAHSEVEMGSAALARYAADIPIVDFFYMPFRGKDLKDLARLRAADSPVRQATDDALLSQGLRVLWWQSYGRILLLSPRAPAKTPLSMSGAKVRVFGPRGADLAEIAGGFAARLPAPELKSAFQTYSLDHAMIDVATIGRLALWEDARVATIATFGSIELPVVIGESVWAALSEENRQALLKAAAVAQEDADERISILERAVLSDLASHGVLLHRYGQDEFNAWESVVEEMLRRYEGRSGQLGSRLLKDAEAFLAEEAN